MYINLYDMINLTHNTFNSGDVLRLIEINHQTK